MSVAPPPPPPPPPVSTDNKGGLFPLQIGQDQTHTSSILLLAEKSNLEIAIFANFGLGKFSFGSAKNFMFAFEIEIFIVCHVFLLWIFSVKGSIKLQLF